MKARFVNENSNYPPGAEYDPRAPWNQPDDDSETRLEIKNGDYILVTVVPISEDDEEEIERSSIDPYDMDMLICQKLGLDFEEMEQEGESIDIQNVDQEGEEFHLSTDKGEVTVTLSELETLVSIGEKRAAEWRRQR